MKKNNIEGLNCYVKQTNTNKYNYYIISDISFVLTVLLKIKWYESYLWKDISNTKPENEKMFIPLCKNTNDRYHFNIMRIIAIIYHIYIESELYNLAYGKVKVGPIKYIF